MRGGPEGEGRRLYSTPSCRVPAWLAFFFSAFAAGCASLPAPPPPPLDAVLADAGALLGERLPRSALARLDALPEPSETGPATRWLLARVRAAFAADDLAHAGADCARLGELEPMDPAWRPACWEVTLEAAGDRATAMAAVTDEIDALLAHAPDDPRRLQAAYLGHLARHDRDARLPLLEQLAARVVDAGWRAWVADQLAEEALGAASPEVRLRLVLRLLALAPEHRLADGLVAWVLGEGAPSDLAEAHALLGFDGGPPSWRTALALAEWGLDQERPADPDVVAALLDFAEAGAGPDALTLEPSHLDPDSRAWLWARAATRLVVTRARTLERQGAPRGALALLDKAPATDPPSATVAYWRGRISEGLGDAAAARDHYRTALVRAAHPEAEARLVALGEDGDEGDSPPRGGPVFDDVTVAAGLDGVAAQRVAWGDPDGDGDPDLLLDGRVFLNDGGGRFAEAPRPAGPAATGGLWADVDGDGATDLLLTGPVNRLLLNRGAAGWEARELPDGAGRRTEAAAFADVDGDGDLDLYLANYERGGTRRGLCHADQLLRNRGDGRFDDVTAAAGLGLEQPLCGRGMAWIDVDGDRRPDALVGNYRLGPNLLWRNLGNGRFAEAGAAWGVRGSNRDGAFGHTIAVAPGDLDGDGREDLVLTNLAHPRVIEFSDRTQVLLTSAGSPPPYVDRRAESGLRFAETESDAALGDVDNDGDLDLFVTAIYPGRWSRLYLNDGRGGLSDVSWRAGVRVANGWGAAFADIDGDGALDLMVASADGVRLLRNRGGGGHWLGVRLDDPTCQRDGVGAEVTLRAAGRAQLRVVRLGRGTGSQDGPALHFGLGDHAGPLTLEAVNACGARFGAELPHPDRRVTLHGPR